MNVSGLHCVESNIHIHQHSSAPCAMHTRTDCPMQHYTTRKLSREEVVTWSRNVQGTWYCVGNNITGIGQYCRGCDLGVFTNQPFPPSMFAATINTAEWICHNGTRQALLKALESLDRSPLCGHLARSNEFQWHLCLHGLVHDWRTLLWFGVWGVGWSEVSVYTVVHGSHSNVKRFWWCNSCVICVTCCTIIVILLLLC